MAHGIDYQRENESAGKATGRELMKAHVKGHIRVVDGKVVWIKDHEDKRAGRVAKLHERTTMGQHKTKGVYLRATDKDDAATIAKTFERVTGRKVEGWKGQANHHGELGSFNHFKVKDAEEGARVLAELAKAHEAEEEVQPGLFGDDEPAMAPAQAGTAPASTNPPMVYAMSHVPHPPISALGAGKEVYFTPGDHAVSKGPLKQGAEYVRGTVVDQRLKRAGDPYDEDRVTIAYDGGKKTVRRSKVALPEALLPVAEKDRAAWQAAEDERQAEKAKKEALAPAPKAYTEDQAKRFDKLLPIAADSWDRLRGVDVDRLFENTGRTDFKGLAAYIGAKRPELQERAGEAAAEAEKDRADIDANMERLEANKAKQIDKAAKVAEGLGLPLSLPEDKLGGAFKAGELKPGVMAYAKANYSSTKGNLVKVLAIKGDRATYLNMATMKQSTLPCHYLTKPPAAAPAPAAAPMAAGAQITPANINDLKRGDVFTDQAGKEYAFWDARYDTVTAHPVVDGKPQVSATTKTLFWIAPDKTPPGDAYRTDPIFRTPAEEHPAELATSEARAAALEGPKPGDTRTVNGRTYRLNENSRWERVEEGQAPAEQGLAEELDPNEVPATTEEVQEAEGRIFRKGDGWGFTVFGTKQKAAQGPYHDEATAISAAINNRRAVEAHGGQAMHKLVSDGSVERVLEARKAEPGAPTGPIPFVTLPLPERPWVEVPADKRQVKVKAGRKKVAITLPEKVRSPLVVNYGMGTDSTAMLVLLVEQYKHGDKNARPDKIVFSDTGSESPHTYAYVEKIQAYLKANDFPPVTIIGKKFRKGLKDTSLHESCERLGTMPSLAYGGKSCSLKWKAAEMDMDHGQWDQALEAKAVGLPLTKLIGYDASTADMRRSKNPGNKKEQFAYPLRDAGLKRDDLKAIIEAAGLPQPGKSACFLCPASKKPEVVELAKKDPGLAAAALRIEAKALRRSIEEGKLSTTVGLGRRWSWHGVLEEAGLLPELEAKYDCGTENYAAYVKQAEAAKAKGVKPEDEPVQDEPCSGFDCPHASDNAGDDEEEEHEEAPAPTKSLGQRSQEAFGLSKAAHKLVARAGKPDGSITADPWGDAEEALLASQKVNQALADEARAAGKEDLAKKHEAVAATDQQVASTAKVNSHKVHPDPRELEKLRRKARTSVEVAEAFEQAGMTEPKPEQGPKDGDERQVNGRTYRLVDGRWHRVGEEGQLERLGKDGWTAKTEEEAAPAPAPAAAEPASPILKEFPGYNGTAYRVVQGPLGYGVQLVDTDAGEPDTTIMFYPSPAQALNRAETLAKDSFPEDEPAAPVPAAEAVPPAPIPDPEGPAAFRARLSVQEPEGDAFEKKYGTTYVLNNGEKVAKIAKWHRTTDGVTLYGINDLKERKGRARFGTDPGQLVKPCESLDDALDKYAMDLYAQEQDRLAKEAEKKNRAAKIRAHKKAAAIANATPATRPEVTRALLDEPEVPQEAPKPEPYDFTPSRALIQQGEINQTVPDYTAVIPVKVTLANRKTILDTPRPSYIPPVDMDWFARCSGRLEGVKLGEDRYLICTDRPRGQRMGYYETGAEGKRYALVNLAALVATQDFCSKRQKALEDQALATGLKVGDMTGKVMRWMLDNPMAGIPSPEGLSDKAEEFMPGLPEAKRAEVIRLAAKELADFKRGVGPRGATPDAYLAWVKEGLTKRLKKGRLVTIGSNKMTHSHAGLLREAFPERKTATWPMFHEYLDDLRQAASDMEIQMEETVSSYAKGKETSYGRKGAQDDLFESHGVLVKRQNGDEIAPFEVEEVKKALDDVYSVIGDRSSLAKRTKLLISHAGIVNQHASKAIGMYVPSRTAIGVTWAHGDHQAGFTLAHEFAHFMDNQLGIMSGRNHYASDDRTGLENRIATVFRKHMKEKQDSAYQNRTCECFARAMEQYFATATGADKAYQAVVNTGGNHPTQEVFAQRVQPLIEEFLSTRGPLLKAITGRTRPA